MNTSLATTITSPQPNTLCAQHALYVLEPLVRLAERGVEQVMGILTKFDDDPDLAHHAPFAVELDNFTKKMARVLTTGQQPNKKDYGDHERGPYAPIYDWEEVEEAKTEVVKTEVIKFIGHDGTETFDCLEWQTVTTKK